MKNYRHGDICLLGVEKANLEGLNPQKKIHGGSHGHPHSIVGGEFFPKRSGENILGFLVVAEGGYLTHKEHGEVVEGESLKRAYIEPGTYEVRVQVEDTHEGMREVVD